MRLRELEKKRLVAFRVMVVFPDYLKIEVWNDAVSNTIEGYENIHKQLLEMACHVEDAIKRLKEANREKEK